MTFKEFRAIYPKKSGDMKKAEILFNNLDMFELEKLKEHIVKYVEYCKTIEYKYILMITTYLKQKRFYDELPEPKKKLNISFYF